MDKGHDKPAGKQEGLRAEGALFREVTRLHARAQRLQASCIGCTLTECHVLTELGRAGGPLALTELGKHLGLHKGWVSRTVAGLAGTGFVKRETAEDDGRVILVSLTNAGTARYHKLDQALTNDASAILGRIPAENRKGIRSSLESMREALRETLDRP